MENVFCIFWVFDAKENTSKVIFGNHICVCVYVFLFFFFFMRLWDLRLLFMHCIWTVTTQFDFSYLFQPISAYRALFIDPQISLFSNFFIKNESHDIIHIFKNYFVTVFFSFQFQFSVFSCIQTDPKCRMFFVVNGKQTSIEWKMFSVSYKRKIFFRISHI